ncbi:MAG: SDR family NAD(P)-dependent oxidoreductase [Pseudomonadota bacterium]
MRRALVTGASSAIGAAVSEALAGAGRDVTLLANTNLARAETTAEAIRGAGGAARALRLDLGDAAACTEQLGELAVEAPFQIFVHCVGAHRDKPFAGMSFEEWTSVIDVNLNSFFVALRPIIMPMIRTRWGRIVAVSSLSGVAGNRGQSNYAAAKGGLHPLIKTLSREYGSRGLTANVVAPGLIDTAATRREKNWDDLVSISASGRAGHPWEVAALVAFLASEAAGYISGQTICIDGGTT